MADKPDNGKTADKPADDKKNDKTTTMPTPIGIHTPVAVTFLRSSTPTQSATISQGSQTTPDATSSSTDSNSSNSAAITGGLVGGIFALVGIVLLLWFARQGRKRISYRRTINPSWLPSSSPTTSHHRPLSLPPSMQPIRAMHPVIESPFEEQYGQRPILQP